MKDHFERRVNFEIDLIEAYWKSPYEFANLSIKEKYLNPISNYL